MGVGGHDAVQHPLPHTRHVALAEIEGDAQAEAVREPAWGGGGHTVLCGGGRGCLRSFVCDREDIPVFPEMRGRGSQHSQDSEHAAIVAVCLLWSFATVSLSPPASIEHGLALPGFVSDVYGQVGHDIIV